MYKLKYFKYRLKYDQLNKLYGGADEPEPEPESEPESDPESDPESESELDSSDSQEDLEHKEIRELLEGPAKEGSKWYEEFEALLKKDMSGYFDKDKERLKEYVVKAEENVVKAEENVKRAQQNVIDYPKFKLVGILYRYIITQLAAGVKLIINKKFSELLKKEGISEDDVKEIENYYVDSFKLTDELGKTLEESKDNLYQDFKISNKPDLQLFKPLLSKPLRGKSFIDIIELDDETVRFMVYPKENSKDIRSYKTGIYKKDNTLTEAVSLKEYDFKIPTKLSLKVLELLVNKNKADRKHSKKHSKKYSKKHSKKPNKYSTK